MPESAQEDAPDNEVDTCAVAMNAAFEKSMEKFCTTEEARVENLAGLVGLEAGERDFSVDERASESVDGDSTSVEVRQRVVALSEEAIADGDSVEDAMSDAWQTVSEEQVADPPEPDDNGEPAPDDPEDEPDALDEALDLDDPETEAEDE